MLEELFNSFAADLNRPGKPSRAGSRYTRPCDACAVRKVKCDTSQPCRRCVQHEIKCTYDRARKKTGPKQLHPKTHSRLSVVLLLLEPRFSVDELMPYLVQYQQLYYGIWPVVLVAELTQRLMVPGEVSAYALGCAVLAAVGIQMLFLLTPQPPLGQLYTELAQAASDTLHTHRLRLLPLVDYILCCFFLYIHHICNPGGTPAAIMSLREGITMAQLMGLHLPATYTGLSAARSHQLHKLYYLLLVTERFICIQDLMPVLLESTVDYPKVADDEFPMEVNGFTELIKVFAIPDKPFFDRVITARSAKAEVSRRWAIDVQFQLTLIQIAADLTEAQKLNLVLLKYWMQMLCWHICKHQGMLEQTHGFDCLLVLYPIHVARRFLEELATLPLLAFELNGPGVAFKLCELAEGLCDSIDMIEVNHTLTIAHHFLRLLHTLVARLRNELLFPQVAFQRIDAVVVSGPPLAPTFDYVLHHDELTL